MRAKTFNTTKIYFKTSKRYFLDQTVVKLCCDCTSVLVPNVQTIST